MLSNILKLKKKKNEKFQQFQWCLSGDKWNKSYKYIFFLSASCELGCFIAQTGHGYNFGNVADGTNCDQMDDGIFSDKCINGQCVVSTQN